MVWRTTHAHEYEQRAHRRGCTELVEVLGTIATQRAHSSAGWFFNLEGLLINMSRHDFDF